MLVHAVDCRNWPANAAWQKTPGLEIALRFPHLQTNGHGWMIFPLFKTCQVC
jgi:hypothetical protein